MHTKSIRGFDALAAVMVKFVEASLYAVYAPIFDCSVPTIAAQPLATFTLIFGVPFAVTAKSAEDKMPVVRHNP